MQHERIPRRIENLGVFHVCSILIASLLKFFVTFKQLCRSLRPGVLEAVHPVLVLLLHLHLPLSTINLLHLQLNFFWWSSKLFHLFQELIEPSLNLATFDLCNDLIEMLMIDILVFIHWTSTMWVTLSSFLVVSSSDLRVTGGLPAEEEID